MPRRTTCPDLTHAHSAEGIDQAETLAADAMDEFVMRVAQANLDTTIAATFLVAELLAGLKLHGGVEPEALVAQFRHLIDQRVAVADDSRDHTRRDGSHECSEAPHVLH